jgi:anti-anti-sigma factor
MISHTARFQTRTLPSVGRVQLALYGDVDLSCADRLRHEARALVDERWDIVLDLAEVSFIDCAGVHALNDVCGDADARGRRAFLTSPSDAVRRIVELLDEPNIA